MTGTGGWIDLTHVISPDLPRPEKFAPPVVEKLSSIPDDPFSLTRLDMVCHTGTHLDAPNHFVLGADGSPARVLVRERT